MEIKENKQVADQVEVESDRAMIYIPHNSIEVEINAKVYNGGNKVEVLSRTMDMDEIKEAVRKAEEGYIDEDDKFEITDKGRKYLDSLNERVVL